MSRYSGVAKGGSGASADNSPVIQDVIANRPSATGLDRLFYGTDTGYLYSEGASTWTQLLWLGYQPLDADLTAIAALSTTSYGRSLLTLADLAAARAALKIPYTWKTDVNATPWSNDNTAHSLLGSTKTFGAFAQYDRLNLRGWLSWLNNSGANQALTLAITLSGGTTLFTATSRAIGTSAQAHECEFDIDLVCTVVGNAFTGKMHVYGEWLIDTASSSAFDGLANVGDDISGGSERSGVITDDSTHLTFDVTAQMSTNTATSTVTPGLVIATYYPA